MKEKKTARASTTPAGGSGPDARLGVIAGLLAYSLWGVFPVYFKLVDTVAPAEVLVHRVVWAVPFGALIIAARRQWTPVRQAFRDGPMLAWLGLAALCISANWFIYIWAVVHNRIFEASLGYYINPLVYVVVGVVFFGERLNRLKSLAVALAAVGVGILTVNGGVLPWVSLSLALLFTAYGVIRKQVAIGAMPGLFIETLMLLPFAAGWLAWLAVQGRAAFTAGDASLTGLLLLAGPITVLPLLFFATAARNVSLTTLGFLQFLAPTLQFLTALWYGEVLSPAKLACFACIWVAVTVFSADALRAATKKPPPATPAGA